MVAVGFKAKWSAAFLVVVLSIFNVFVNNFWTVHTMHPERDFLKSVVSFLPWNTILTSTTDTISSRRYVCVIISNYFLDFTYEYITAIVGGLILLVNMGPGMFPTSAIVSCTYDTLITGGLSVDEKKKTY